MLDRHDLYLVGTGCMTASQLCNVLNDIFGPESPVKISNQIHASMVLLVLVLGQNLLPF